MLRWRAAALVLFLTGLASAEAQDRPGALVFPAPDRPVAGITSPTYSDEKTRDGHGEAERVMNLLGIMPGQRVADVGAGLGYYTVRLSRRLGLGATIYATDVKAEYLDQLRARLKREQIDWVRTILGRPRDPLLPMNSVDVVILSHMYHEIENPYEFLYRLQPALAPGARVGIIDTDEPTQRHGTPPALLRCELAAVGYRELNFVLLAPADGYLAIFVPPETLPKPEAITPCRASGSRSMPTATATANLRDPLRTRVQR
jgi:SAM-dependent methyltransferase